MSEPLNRGSCSTGPESAGCRQSRVTGRDRWRSTTVSVSLGRSRRRATRDVVPSAHGDQVGLRDPSIRESLGPGFDRDDGPVTGAGTRLLELHVETHCPSGLGLLGRLVGAAILSPCEGRKELGRLKALIESDLGA